MHILVWFLLCCIFLIFFLLFSLLSLVTSCSSVGTTKKRWTIAGVTTFILTIVAAIALLVPMCNLHKIGREKVCYFKNAHLAYTYNNCSFVGNIAYYYGDDGTTKEFDITDDDTVIRITNDEKGKVEKYNSSFGFITCPYYIIYVPYEYYNEQWQLFA